MTPTNLFPVLLAAATLAVALGATPSIRTEAGSVQVVVEEGKDVEFVVGDEVVATVAGINSGIAKARRDAEATSCDTSKVLAKSSTEVSAELTAKVAGIMADSIGVALANISQTQATISVKALEISASATSSKGTKVVALFNTCPKDGCRAMLNKITLVAESVTKERALIPGHPMYTCRFTSSSLKSPMDYTTSSSDGHSVDCMVPNHDSTKISSAKWTARLSLLKGVDGTIPYVNPSNAKAMDVAVTSVGPAIVEGIQDVDTKIHALVKSVSVYLYKMTVKITDADSPAASLKMEVITGNKRVKGTIVAVKDQADMYTITLALSEDKAIETKITVNVVDNHKHKATASFGFRVSVFGCEDRLKTVRFDGNGKLRGGYGVKKVEKLKHKGTHGLFKIYWETPFLNTKYAVTGMTTGRGSEAVELNIEPHNGYKKDQRGQTAVDQFLHKEYVVVGMKDQAGTYRDTSINHVIAMTASKDDGCDNTNVHLATYVTINTATAPVAKPDTVFSYNMLVENGDGGSGGRGCKHRVAWRHRLINAASSLSHGYALSGITNNIAGTSSTYWELEGDRVGNTYADTYLNGFGFCAGVRHKTTNGSPRYKGQFNSVILFGKRLGVKYWMGDSLFQSTYKHDQIDRHARSGNRQGFNFQPPYKHDNFAIAGTANMHCSGGEHPSFDASIGVTRSRFFTRTTYHNGSPSAHSSTCGLMLLFSVDGSAFTKDGK